MNYCTYILYSPKDDRYYIGQTSNVESRLERHNKGYVKSTKAFRPWSIVFTKEFETRAESMNYETYLKSLKSKKALKELVDTSR